MARLEKQGMNGQETAVKSTAKLCEKESEGLAKGRVAVAGIKNDSGKCSSHQCYCKCF